jgi:hypothetical protein
VDKRIRSFPIRAQFEAKTSKNFTSAMANAVFITKACRHCQFYHCKSGRKCPGTRIGKDDSLCLARYLYKTPLPKASGGKQISIAKEEVGASYTVLFLSLYFAADYSLKNSEVLAKSTPNPFKVAVDIYNSCNEDPACLSAVYG